MNVIICYATCWSCKFGFCNPDPHPWWNADDVEYAEEYNEPLPTGYCACYCSQDAVSKLEKEEDNVSV